MIRDHVDPIGEGTLTTRSRKTLPPVRISGKYSPLVPTQSEEPFGKNGPLDQDPPRIKVRAPQALPKGIAGATTDPADPRGPENLVSDRVWHAGWERTSVRFCTPPGLLRTVQVQTVRALQAGATFYKGLRSIAAQGRAGGGVQKYRTAHNYQMQCHGLLLSRKSGEFCAIRNDSCFPPCLWPKVPCKKKSQA